MKINCIIQARMGSERLPGKVILPILNKQIILYTLDRLNKSKYIDQLIVATSDNESENSLVDIVKKNGYEVFRGDEKDVLKRYKEASDVFKSDIILRVTGDCPMVDSDIVDNVITYYKMNNYDYVRLDVPNTFIRGFDVEVFSKKVLDQVDKLAKTTSEREHVTLYIYNNPEKFNIGYVKGNEFYNKDYRLCVDTKEDFDLVNKIYESFKDEFVPAKEIVKYLDNNMKLVKINSMIKQKDC